MPAVGVQKEPSLFGEEETIFCGSKNDSECTPINANGSVHFAQPIFHSLSSHCPNASCPHYSVHRRFRNSSSFPVSAIRKGGATDERKLLNLLIIVSDLAVVLRCHDHGLDDVASRLPAFVVVLFFRSA